MAGNKTGGAETACIDMVLAMHEAGETVALATRDNPRNERLTQAGIPFFTLPFGGWADIYTPLALKRIIREFKPQIVQSWMSRGASKVPAWTENMGADRYFHVSRLGGYYKLKYFKTSDYFTTITPDIKRHLVEAGIDDARVRHINNFAETESATVPASRTAHGIRADAPLVLALGRLHEAKAHDVLIKAVAGLPDVYLWIAGEGPARSELEQLIGTLGVEARVKLLGWRNDRAALFQASDLCVFASRYEPFGTVFAQSWEQKVPVVVSDADGPAQYVRDGEDGLMVPKNDVESLRSAIRRCLDDTNLRQKLIKNGYSRYQTEFTKRKSVGAYLSFYREILDAAGTAASLG